jgi:hypothetical protein
VIRAVTETLVDHLLAETPDLGTWVKAAAVDTDAPALTSNQLHLFLYGIDEHAHMRNRPLESTPDGYVQPDLFLRLSYGAHFESTDHLETQARLARVVQVFHTTPILRPPAFRPELVGHVQRLTIRLRSPSLEERNQLWTGMGRAMRLAVYYDVDVAPVPPLSREGRGRVETLQFGFDELEEPVPA